MNNIIDQADRPAPSKLEFLTPRPETWKNYSSCPWAKSILQIDPETDDLLLTPVTCKRWGCIYCARRKIRKLAFLTHGANPNRWIRLGVDPQLWESPEAAWRATSPKLPECCKLIRKERGECEYLRVTELHESGWPHYHALLRSSLHPPTQTLGNMGDTHRCTGRVDRKNRSKFLHLPLPRQIPDEVA